MRLNSQKIWVECIPSFRTTLCAWYDRKLVLHVFALIICNQRVNGLTCAVGMISRSGLECCQYRSRPSQEGFQKHPRLLKAMFKGCCKIWRHPADSSINWIRSWQREREKVYRIMRYVARKIWIQRQGRTVSHIGDFWIL